MFATWCAALPRPLYAMLLATAACIALQPGLAAAEDVAPALPPLQLAASEADDLVIVDCALPPQVRALGTGMVYAAARKVTKLPASECRIRGGEYIVPTRAIDAWLPGAQAGDPEAMTYVGEIYEKGIGQPRDPAKAAEWYGRAADKGYARAQVSLAELYERGDGVPRDPAKAISLYRKAGGLPDQAIDPNTAQKLKDLQDKLDQRDRDCDALRNQLLKQKSDLQNERAQLDRLQREASRGAPAAAPAQRDPDAVRRQQEAAAAVAKERENSAKLAARIKDLEAQLANSNAQGADRAQTSAAETTRLKSDLQKLNGDLAATKSSLAQKQAELDAARKQSASAAASASSSGATNDKLQRDLKQRQAALDDKEKRIAALETQLKQAETERDQLKITQAGPMRSIDPSAASTPAPGSTIPHDKLGNYHALVIGINNYQQLPHLETAVNDAKEIARILKDQYGFNVTLLVDATRHDILAALNDLRAKLTNKDNLLIYYAGHGELDSTNQHGNWLPVDAEPTGTANWISDSDITNQLNLMTARQVMIIADSCYGGSLTRGSGASLAPGMSDDVLLARIMTQKKSRMVLSSGGLEPVLDDLGGSHSVFAAAVINVLVSNKGLISGTDLYQRVIPLVTKAAFNVRARQVPEYGQIKFAGHESGDFFFAAAL